MVKNLPAGAGEARDQGLILGQEGPLEEEVATHSSILAWEILWTEEPSVDENEAAVHWLGLLQVWELRSHMSLSQKAKT